MPCRALSSTCSVRRPVLRRSSRPTSAPKPTGDPRPPRQTAIVLLLLIWVSYFGWDSLHGYRNPEFRSALDDLLWLRVAGTVCIFLAGASLMLWRDSRRTIVTALSFCVGALYLLSLAMIAVTAFPYNYLFYYICLPMILLFMFGLFRLESRLVYALAGLCLVASFVFLMFTQTTETAAPKNILEFLSKSLSYYNVAALLFLSTFSLIGCAVVGRAGALGARGLRPRAAAFGQNCPAGGVAARHAGQDGRPGQGEGRAARARRAAECRQVEIPRRRGPRSAPADAGADQFARRGKARARGRRHRRNATTCSRSPRTPRASPADRSTPCSTSRGSNRASSRPNIRPSISPP